MEAAIDFLQNFLAQIGIELEPKMNLLEAVLLIGILFRLFFFAP